MQNWGPMAAVKSFYREFTRNSMRGKRIGLNVSKGSVGSETCFALGCYMRLLFFNELILVLSRRNFTVLIIVKATNHESGIPMEHMPIDGA